MSAVISARSRQLESIHERISTLMLDLTDEDEAKADQAFETLMTPKETPPKTRLQRLTQNCAAWGWESLREAADLSPRNSSRMDLHT